MKERKNYQIFKMKRTIDNVVVKIWTKFEKKNYICLNYCNHRHYKHNFEIITLMIKL